MKLELLTNATVVDDAIRFVFQRSKDDNNEDDNKELNEPDYDEYRDQLQEEDETGETAGATINLNWFCCF